MRVHDSTRNGADFCIARLSFFTLKDRRVIRKNLMTSIAPSSANAQNANSGNTQNFIQALFTFVILSGYVGMGRSRIYALIDEGKFPPPIKIGRSSRWLKSEIDSWITEQASARQSVQAGV